MHVFILVTLALPECITINLVLSYANQFVIKNSGVLEYDGPFFNGGVK